MAYRLGKTAWGPAYLKTQKKLPGRSHDEIMGWGRFREFFGARLQATGEFPGA